MKDIGIHHFQECVVSNFECTLQEKYKFSANPVSRKDLVINMTTFLVIQVQVFVIFVRGFRNILHVNPNFIENQRI